MTPVQRLWPDSTIVCIGSGPSLVQEDVNACLGVGTPVIVINDTYKLAPWADALFAADYRWWVRNPEAQSFRGLKFGANRRISDTRSTPSFPNVHVLKVTNRDGFDPRPDCIRSGANSGYMAIHLAVHLGATKIILLGYDMAPSKDGRLHWHADHSEQRPMQFRQWINSMTGLSVYLREHGITVINASRESALQCFDRKPLKEALAWITTQKSSAN